MKSRSCIKRLLSLLIIVSMLFAIAANTVISSSAAFSIVIQNLAKWDNYVYGTGTLRATGCGIFSLVNAVGYLTGETMDVPSVAQWAYDLGAYNKGGADGTYRLELYPYVNDKYGDEYGINVDTNGTSGWWASATSSVLTNHLLNGGTAIAHVYGHFIAIVGYNFTDKTYHVYDSYPTTARGTGTGDCWVTQSWITTSSKLTVDWFCLVSLAETNKVKAPVISANTVVDHGSALSVSWDTVTNATSYNYKAEVYNGEMSATTPTTVVSSSTTGTSFTVPAQSSGKYMKLTVTAVGPENTASSTATVMMGPWIGSYPTDVEYIPVVDVNGSVSASSSTIWTSSKGSTFGMTWWRAFVCSPNSDGTYTVNTIYENGVEKSVSVSGTQVLFVIHSGYTNYSYAGNIVVGDKLTFVGIYLDNATVRGSGYVLVNGGISIGPDSLTIKTDSDISYNAEYVSGAIEGNDISSFIAKFNEDAEYISVTNAAGTVVSTGTICTGYTVNLVVNGVTKESYTVAVQGDIDGDGSVTTADMLLMTSHISSRITITGAYAVAGDFDDSNSIESTDFLLLKYKLIND